jgi:hypothetical protein
MRRRAVQAGLVVQLLLAAPSVAMAEPVSSPHGTLDYRLTTAQPGAPAGWTFTGTYHAAGDAQALPPYMRRMTFYHPPGMRFDTGVPGRCTASDAELAVRGAAACPADSRLGGGTVWISFMGGVPRPSAVEHFNNTDEQIVVGRSPGVATIVRAHMHPDGSVEYESPTCYPSVPPLGCPVDNSLQVKSAISVPPYTRGGRSYLTTPPDCPASGRWETPVRFWWADGTVDTAVTEQPCTSP